MICEFNFIFVKSLYVYKYSQVFQLRSNTLWFSAWISIDWPFSFINLKPSVVLDVSPQGIRPPTILIYLSFQRYRQTCLKFNALTFFFYASGKWNLAYTCVHVALLQNILMITCILRGKNIYLFWVMALIWNPLPWVP